MLGLPSPSVALWNSGQKRYYYTLPVFSFQKSPHSEKQKKDGVHTHTYSSVHRPQPCFTWLNVEPPYPNLNPFCSDLIPRCCFTRSSSPVQNNSFSFSESFSSGPDCVVVLRVKHEVPDSQNVRIYTLIILLSCLACRTESSVWRGEGGRERERKYSIDAT